MSERRVGSVWLGWGDINQIADQKKLVFFGRGEWMEKSIKYLNRAADYVVDNNRYEHGQQEAGLEIYSPERLLTENADELFIVITTSGFPDVERQLRGYEFKPGVHFCVSPSLKNFQIVSKLNNHSQVIHFTCSDRPRPDDIDCGGGLYAYNLSERKKTKIISGLCHGIARLGDSIILVDDTVGIRLLNRDLKTTRSFELPAKSRPHGIAYCPVRNFLFVCFSGRDSIGIYDAKTCEIVSEIAISNKFARSGVAQHHINDCCVHEDYLYVSMFSFSGNWKIGMYDGGVLQFDIDAEKCLGPVINDLWMPHTPTIINDVMYYCDSMRGVVSDTTWRIMTEFNGFVRGITFDGTFFYIGQSAHRYIDRREGTTNNISLDTGIFMVHPTHKATKFFSIPELGDINSVIVID